MRHGVYGETGETRGRARRGEACGKISNFEFRIAKLQIQEYLFSDL